MSLAWKTEKRKVADLNEWEQNPRKISQEDFEKLKEGIRLRGFHDVIKIDTDGTIISGHQRKRALTDLGIEEVEVIVPSRPLTEDERKQVAVESNLHRGTFDFDILGNSFDVDMLLDRGMSKFDLALIPTFDLNTETGTEDDVPPPAPEAHHCCRGCVCAGETSGAVW